LLAGLVLYIIASGVRGFDITASGFAANGVGSASPEKYRVIPCLLTEMVLTGMFLLVIMGATDKRAPAGMAPIAIGLALTLIHLISIPVTNTSVNPARSTGVAFFAGSIFIRQLWMFWVFPIIGALVGGLIYRLLFEDKDEARAALNKFQN
jgi:aquaporin Z